ncbi:MAG: rhodanese-like domain-containing protein [Nitrospirota bacterium]|nr:rhodanese-like domain-containing protein [Nitrospirota bacterium]
MSSASFLLAIVALWMVWRVRQELSLVKRERYYLEQKLKSISPQMEALVEPLRIQTALLAQGKPVSNQLIRAGRLYHEISAKEAGEYFSADFPDPQVLWLDVRTNSEFGKQHIPGATLIPVEDLEMRYQTEVPSTVEKIFVYCAGGDRSRLACDFLSRHEFGNVYHIKDGLQAWSGPMEGTGAGGLIQIASKQRSTNQMGSPVSTSMPSS